MRHLLLLLHINVAAHMTLPLVRNKDANVLIDPLELYERVNRFLLDVLFAGLMKRIPIDFKREKGVPPLIPLTPTLQFLTRMLNNDLDREQQVITQGFLKRRDHSLYSLVSPPMFLSAHDLINDPIIYKYWPVLREEAISIISQVILEGKSIKVAVAAWAPKSTAMALKIRYGVSTGLTLFMLMLRQEQDFWDLAVALKGWFERHNINSAVKLVAKPQLALLGEKRIETLPEQDNSTALIPALNLVTDRPRAIPVNRAEDLISSKKQSVIVLPSASPDSLFTTRKRVVIPKQDDSKNVADKFVSNLNYF
jgi:hypothetical protein